MQLIFFYIKLWFRLCNCLISLSWRLNNVHYHSELVFVPLLSTNWLSFVVLNIISVVSFKNLIRVIALVVTGKWFVQAKRFEKDDLNNK